MFVGSSVLNAQYHSTRVHFHQKDYKMLQKHLTSKLEINIYKTNNNNKCINCL